MDSDSSASSVVEELAAARMQTDIVGALHELQAHQMKIWPMLLFDKVVSSEARVDIGDGLAEFDADGNKHRKNRLVKVEYHIVLKDSLIARTDEDADRLDMGLSNLKQWTCGIFWPDTQVKIFLNEVEYYERPRQS